MRSEGEGEGKGEGEGTCCRDERLLGAAIATAQAVEGLEDRAAIDGVLGVPSLAAGKHHSAKVLRRARHLVVALFELRVGADVAVGLVIRVLSDVLASPAEALLVPELQALLGKRADLAVRKRGGAQLNAKAAPLNHLLACQQYAIWSLRRLRRLLKLCGRRRCTPLGE